MTAMWSPSSMAILPASSNFCLALTMTGCTCADTVSCQTPAQCYRSNTCTDTVSCQTPAQCYRSNTCTDTVSCQTPAQTVSCVKHLHSLMSNTCTVSHVTHLHNVTCQIPAQCLTSNTCTDVSHVSVSCQTPAHSASCETPAQKMPPQCLM